MKPIRINSYFAFFVIAAVGSACAFFIINTANSAEADATSYYTNAYATADGTATPPTTPVVKK